MYWNFFSYFDRKLFGSVGDTASCVSRGAFGGGGGCKKIHQFPIFFGLQVKSYQTQSEKFSAGLSKLYSTCPEEHFGFNFFMWKWTYSCGVGKNLYILRMIFLSYHTLRRKIMIQLWIANYDTYATLIQLPSSTNLHFLPTKSDLQKKASSYNFFGSETIFSTKNKWNPFFYSEFWENAIFKKSMATDSIILSLTGAAPTWAVPSLLFSPYL